MIPLPTCICWVRASTHGISTSLAEMCEYSSKKWCSVNQAYFQLCRSASSHSPTSLTSRSCSAFGLAARQSLCTKPPWKRPNSMCCGPLLRGAAPVSFLERVTKPNGSIRKCPAHPPSGSSARLAAHRPHRWGAAYVELLDDVEAESVVPRHVLGLLGLEVRGNTAVV